MDRPLRVLIVEDSQRDALFEVRALEMAGYRITFAVAETAAEMKAALAEETFDIVISDHDMPQFDAPSALAVLKESGQDIPFIIVSGAIGEEKISALTGAGASDYVPKERLSRLPSTIEYALRDAETRRGIKHAETNLQQTRDRYRILVEQALEGIIVVQDSKIVFANPRAYEISGYPREQTESRPFIDFLHADDRQKVIDRHLRRLKGEQFEESYPIRLVDQNGNVKWALISVARIDWQGKPAALVFLADINETKKAEEALEREKDFVESLINTAQTIILVLDATGHIVTFNTYLEQISGYGLDEVKGKDWFSTFLPADNQAGTRELFLRAINDIRTQGNIDQIVTRDGRTRTIEWHDMTLKDFKGEIIGLLATGQDVTERKLAEEKLVQSYESLKKTLADAINTMVRIVELRDPYTAGHQHRVSELATAIAREMKLEGTRIDFVRMAAVIHDIGKMHVPSDILSKPGRLSDIEFNLIKTHSEHGYDIVKGMDFPQAVAMSVLQHHERIDGSGYPNQLKGAETLLEARILAVADVVEAMASHRPYRAALGLEKAMEEITNNRGKIYDPVVVDACLELFKSGQFEFKTV